MNLSNGYPYWLINSGIPYNYSKLTSSLSTRVVIIGGGVSGALSAYILTVAGIECILVDARSIGMGSTCASTALLQYELDKPLSVLANQVGFKNAAHVYQLCAQAIQKIETISKKIKFTEFSKQQSLYFAAFKKHKKDIETEFAFRKKAGFDVQLLDERDTFKRFGFKAPASILSAVAATIDPYLFTHALLQAAIKKGLQVYDRTGVLKTSYTKNGVNLITNEGVAIKAKKIINATGYEIKEFIDKKIVKLSSTYAIASEHMESEKPLWDQNTLLWNTADPYLYIRHTKDRRIIVGGRDEDFYNPTKRDGLIKKKSQLLVKDFEKLFPKTNILPEFCWCGTFGSTKDSLPYIGTYTKTPHTYYALGFGGNGITFSVIAAEQIRDMILGKKNKDARLFSFSR